MKAWQQFLIIECLALSLAACAANWQTLSAMGGSELEAPSGVKIASLAEGLLGAPYRYGGASPQGFDCSGLVRYVHGRLGMSVPRQAHDQYQSARHLAVRDLQPGDLVFFRLAGSKISHVGIYVGDGRFVHAPTTGKDVGYASLSDGYWWNRFAGAGRFYE